MGLKLVMTGAPDDGDKLVRGDLQVDACYRLLQMLCALNRRYFTRFQVKRVHRLEAQLAIAPPRLADRLDTQRAALAVPRQMATLAEWQQKYRAVGYFDDDYAASQLWKQDWAAADGDRVAARARATVEQIEPLRT